MNVTDEDGEVVSVPAQGGILTVKEFDPVHIAVEKPGSVRNHYGPTGLYDSTPKVREFTNYNIYNGPVMSIIGIPNIIASNFIVIAD